MTDKKISLATLKESCEHGFGNMVKPVVDVESSIIAIGGELRADAEALLLEQGSDQKNLGG